ncbi:MAG TPA: hypothetical protein VM925_12320, partial [Labilithrix sp.]|nr:hypothetical protein [Labilithrix sp.]
MRGTIDDDVRQLLERIETAAAGLVASQPPPDGSVNGRNPAFQIIEDAGHAIYGTSALVAAESLASCARVIEQMAERAQLDLLVAARHRERARKLTELVRTGAGEMRNMLRLELEHSSDEAQWLALEWRQRATEVLEAAIEVEPEPVAAAAEASATPASTAEASNEEPEFDFTGDASADVVIEELDADALEEIEEIVAVEAVAGDARLGGEAA